MENETVNKVHGQVVAISSKTGGVCVNDVWYNPSERVKPYAAKLKKGQQVEMDVTPKKQITFLKVAGGFNARPPSADDSDITYSDNPAMEEEIVLSDEERIAVLMTEISKATTPRALLLYDCINKVDAHISKNPKWEVFAGPLTSTLFISAEKELVAKGLIKSSNRF